MSDDVRHRVARFRRSGRDLYRATLTTADGPAIRLGDIGIAALGVGVPVVACLPSGHAGAGFTIGLGAILLSGDTAATDRPPEAAERLWMAILPAMASVGVATLIAGRAWTDAAMIGVATIAATASGYSRPLAIAAIRFGVYLVLGVGLLDSATSGRHDAALVFGLGAVWTVVLQASLTDRRSAAAMPIDPVWTPSVQLLLRYRKTLRSSAGWQFPARLAFGLAAASAIRHLWPAHHFYWIMLTVVLLTRKVVEPLPVRTMQRLLGTIGGVAITWVISSAITSPPILATLACIFAMLVPIARARSYLLYSSVATPLILLAMDFGKPIEITLLTDRIVSTVIGGGLVLAGNRIADRLQCRQPRDMPMGI